MLPENVTIVKVRYLCSYPDSIDWDTDIVFQL